MSNSPFVDFSPLPLHPHLSKKVLDPGSSSKVHLNSTVTIDYTLSTINANTSSKVDSSIDRTRPLTFTIGDGRVVKGLEICVLSMTSGEKAQFCVPGPYMTGMTTMDAVVDSYRLDIHVKAVTTPYVPLSTRLSTALTHKQSGNSCFSTGELDDAVTEYKSALLQLESTWGLDTLETAQLHDMKVTCASNLALVYLKMSQYQKAKEAAGVALTVDATHKKSLFRAAKACVGLHEWDEAISVLNGGLRAHVDDADLKHELSRVLSEKKASLTGETKMYTRMFQ